jgi:hypothetical protein
VREGKNGRGIFDVKNLTQQAILQEAKILVTEHILKEQPFPNDAEQTLVSVSITAEGFSNLLRLSTGIGNRVPRDSEKQSPLVSMPRLRTVHM